ncbi:hypothetical protein L2E82_11492 [Cichorium intybus]|uniref:Uncharacterized protein n=1 Tax=Cichorium intybus TaxID=13427 RepID=A0ACB9GDB4_CICIN|nr:hypothetical protein L2E82_11492 [Cichorium intybus]
MEKLTNLSCKIILPSCLFKSHSGTTVHLVLSVSTPSPIYRRCPRRTLLDRRSSSSFPDSSSPPLFFSVARWSSSIFSADYSISM